jgi:hypothetical protein
VCGRPGIDDPQHGQHLPFTLVAPSWSQFRGEPTHSGTNPHETLIGVGNVSTLVQAWTGTTVGSVESSPAVANGVTYVGSDDHRLYAFDAATGAPLWIADTGPLGSTLANADRGSLRGAQSPVGTAELPFSYDLPSLDGRGRTDALPSPVPHPAQAGRLGRRPIWHRMLDGRRDHRALLRSRSGRTSGRLD